MSLRNCPRCGKLFVYTTKTLCPSCFCEDENDFELVREYVWEHRGCSALEVQEATGVALDKIMRYLRQGRLEAKYMSSELLFCESCGVPIDQGRFCPPCTERLVKGFKGKELPVQPQETAVKTAEKNKMHLANRFKRK